MKACSALNGGRRGVFNQDHKSFGLAERGFNRFLRNKQKSSLRQLTVALRRFACGASNWLWKESDFPGNRDGEEIACVLVICPLKSIVEDQILEVSSMGLSAGSLLKCDLQVIKSGKFKLLFASVEDALQKDFLSSLKNDKTEFHQNLAAIVTDESHSVPSNCKGFNFEKSFLTPPIPWGN